MSGRRGFTLLEILIGLALSLMVILAVYAGIRTAVRSITAVERIALENKMLGFGVLAAVERADRWNDLDDPYDTSAQPLRVTPSKGYALPPDRNMGSSMDTNWLPYDKRASDMFQIPQPFTPLSESRGWLTPTFGSGFSAYDPDAWLPHRPKSWYRGDHAWYGPSDHLDESAYGNYGIFQAAAEQVHIINGEENLVFLAPWRRWLPDQQLALSYGLGWYGWLDYLPANALIDIYTTSRTNNRAVKPGELRNPLTRRAVKDSGATLLSGSAPDGDPTTVPQWIYDYHGAFAKQRSSGKMSLYRTGAGQAITKGWQTWTIHAGISAIEPSVNRTMAGQYYGAGYYSHEYESLSSLPLLLTALPDAHDLIADTPSDWPLLSVDVRRFNTWGSPRTQCYIRFTDPISGESREVYFPVTCTTLRGARLSRGLDKP